MEWKKKHKVKEIWGIGKEKLLKGYYSEQKFKHYEDFKQSKYLMINHTKRSKIWAYNSYIFQTSRWPLYREKNWNGSKKKVFDPMKSKSIQQLYPSNFQVTALSSKKLKWVKKKVIDPMKSKS